MDENSPSVDGLDSATDLGSEMSLNVPLPHPTPHWGYAGSQETGFQSLLFPTFWVALVAPVLSSGPQSPADCSEPQVEVLGRVRE